MRVLMLSSDKKIFEKGRVYDRMVSYAGLVDRLVILVYTTEPFEQIEHGNLTVIATNTAKKWLYWWGIFMKARKFQFDVLTSQDPLFLGIVGFLLAKFKKAKLEVQVHTDIFTNHFSFYSRMLARFVLSRADGIRVVSKRIQNSLPKKTISKSYVLPIAFDLQKYLSAQKTDFLQKQFAPGSFVFLVVARLEPEKNVDVIIDLVSEISKTQKVGLAIVGDGSLRLQLENKAQEYQRIVKFYGWQENLVRFYSSANAYVSASSFEGFGMSICEAAAAKCPIIMTDTGLADELIFDAQSGIVLPIGNRVALKQAMLFAITHPEVMTTYAEQAKINVESMSNGDAYLKKLQQNWQSLL